MKVRNSLFVFLLAALLLSSCLPNGPALTSSPTATDTVTNTPTATLALPTATIETATPSPLPPTLTLTATLTAIPTAIPSATASPPATPTLPFASATCYKAKLIGNTTDPAVAVIKATQKFTKVWRLFNQGSCTWTPDFQVVSSDGGYTPNSTGSIKIGISVPPLHWVDITFTLIAPDYTGDFSGYYKLASTDGQVFGIGRDGSNPFGFLMAVEGIATSTAFSVTKVIMRVNDSSVDVPCPSGYRFVFSAIIYTNSAGNVTYHWRFSNREGSRPITLSFDKQGSQTVSTSWTEDQTIKGWAQVYIDKPNHQAFSKAHFSITCH